MKNATTYAIERRIGAVALCSLLVGCSDGVSVDNAQPLAGNRDEQHPSRVVNNPLQSALEPHARPWVGTLRQRVATCGGLVQSVDEGFGTDAFSGGTSATGESFLVARSRVPRDTPEYIEFCVQVPELANYRVVARVFASDIDQDSFFITVDEDEPGSLPQPAIYDVKRSENGFIDDVVGTRAQDPLTLALAPGEHLLRFYYREANTALAGIRLEPQGGAPVVGPDTQALAGCAANTGLSEDDVAALVDRHLGGAEANFALEGLPVSFTGPGEREESVKRVNWSFDDGTTRANVLCLSEPPEGTFNLILNTVSENRLVIGSAGADRMRVGTPLRGTLVGNGGNDSVELLETGLFIGGDGDDSVGLMSSEAGVFEGGNGSDLVRVMEGGRFDGGAGSDRLLTQFAGTFDGGPGADAVERQSAGAVAVNVETVGQDFSALAPPTELRFVDATTTSAVLRWTPSTDERVDGYVVTLQRPNDPTDLNDRGSSPDGGALRVTTSPVYVVDRFERAAPVVKVYAFERLDDGSTLYSEPVSLIFEPGVDTDYLNGAELIADRTVDARFVSATLADDGSTVVGYDPDDSPRNAPIFNVFDANLQNERRTEDELTDGRQYSSYLGTSRQYVVPLPGDEQATAIAFNGNASQRLWQRDVTVPIDLPTQEFQRCLFALVTQDDWLICSRVQGGVQAFTPSGDSRRIDDLQLPNFFSLVDGADGRLVYVERADARPFEGFTRVDTDSATVERVEVDLSARLLAGDAEIELLGLAVNGDEAILTGAILATVCNADCVRGQGERTGYFIARAAVSDGQLLAWQRLPLDERPGDGIGLLSPDRASVVFGRQNLLTRYDVASLATLDRRRVPGTVEGVGNAAVLVQQRLLSTNPSPFEVGSRFYLLTP